MISISDALERFEPPDGLEKYARRFSSFEPMWDHCERADWMLWMLENCYEGKLNRLRLFTCRCARRWWAFLVDPRSQRAVNAAEGYATGTVSRDGMEFMRDGAQKAALEAAQASKPILSRAAHIAVLTLDDDVLKAAKETSQIAAAAEHAIHETQSYEHELEILSEQAGYLREVMGNPFCEPAVKQAV